MASPLPSVSPFKPSKIKAPKKTLLSCHAPVPTETPTPGATELGAWEGIAVEMETSEGVGHGEPSGPPGGPRLSPDGPSVGLPDGDVTPLL